MFMKIPLFYNKVIKGGDRMEKEEQHPLQNMLELAVSKSTPRATQVWTVKQD